jgi:hypothetical protein
LHGTVVTVLTTITAARRRAISYIAAYCLMSPGQAHQNSSRDATISPLLDFDVKSKSLVCTENSIRIDWGGNHVTSAHNDRAVMVLANVVRFAVEVEERS